MRWFKSSKVPAKAQEKIPVIVRFNRSYEDLVGTRLLDTLKSLGASYELKPAYPNKEAVYFFDTKSGNYELKKCCIEAHVPGVGEVSFEFDVNYSKGSDVSVVASAAKEYDVKQLLERLHVNKDEEPKQVKRVTHTFDGHEASRQIIEALEQEGIVYRIKPRERYKQVEYGSDEKGEYLTDGLIELEGKGVSLEMEYGHGKYKVSVVSDGQNGMIKDILKGLGGAENIDVEGFGDRSLRITGYSWDDIGGMDSVREELTRYIEWPLKNPEIFKAIGVKPPKGVLLYGPPGCGKTKLAKIIASETSSYFLQATSADLTSMWYGQSEKRIRELFEKARKYTPSIIFIDEIDGLFTSRENNMHEATRRMLGAFLEELDGLQELSGSVLLGATNRLQDLDPAIVRPGRLGKKIEIPLPDQAGRRKILEIHSRKMPLIGVDLDYYASATEKYSGAELEDLCQRAAYHAMERVRGSRSIEDVKPEELSVTQYDFDTGMSLKVPDER